MIQKVSAFLIITHIIILLLLHGSDYLYDFSFINNIDEYLKNIDINIAQLEKIGATFLSIGYAIFFYGADLDIKEATKNHDDYIPTDEVTLFGQTLVLIGYIILYIVNKRRIKEKILLNKYKNDNIKLWPYILITNGYLLSVFSNILRYIGFYYIIILEDSDD